MTPGFDDIPTLLYHDNHITITKWNKNGAIFYTIENRKDGQLEFIKTYYETDFPEDYKKLLHSFKFNEDLLDKI